MKKYNAKVSKIQKNSIAQEVGIEKGDVILSINDSNFHDILEYKYLINEEYIEVAVQKHDGEEWLLEIEKEYNEDLGIIFEQPLIDNERSCHNKCMFCFIDQLPTKMRETLYFKDDDYRLSFLEGNYVTLTNVTDEEIDRIVKYKISPINISVHTTDSELRKKMLNNKNAGKIMTYLHKLTNGGIRINCQIVLCPDVNDKENLDKTINDLSSFYPMLKSVSVVPVGLTKYRENLYPLKSFDKNGSQELIDQIKIWQNKLKNTIGTRFIFVADEFYIMAENEFPDYEHYEEFPQIENGVGLIALFEHEFYKYFNEIKKENIIFNTPKNLSIVTGSSAYDFIKKLCTELENYFKNLKINVFKIKNNFFGQSVTVTGLLTGNDIINQLKEKSLGDELMVPECMLRSGENIFLDNVTIEDLEENLKIKVKISQVNAKDFIDCILGR